MQKRYYVISAKNKTIHTESSELKEEVRSEWFDIASDRFSRLAFWDKAKEVFYVEILAILRTHDVTKIFGPHLVRGIVEIR